MVLAQFSFQAPGSWLLCSLILSLLLLSLKSLFANRESEAHSLEKIQGATAGFPIGAQSQLLKNWVEGLTTTSWFLIPYLGLLFGGLSPRLLGISDIDWLASLGLGSGLIFVVLLLLILVRATTELGSARPLVKPSPTLGIHRALQLPATTTYLSQIIKNGAEELHWCFVRGAVWELLQTAPKPPSLPAYWAVWAAAILVTPEALLEYDGAALRLLNLIVLIATTVLFFYTRNFWLCWLLHVTAKLVINPRPTALTVASTALTK